MSTNLPILQDSFYTREDVALIAQELLGTILHTNIGGYHTSGRIVETEAYSGRNDKAYHANNGKRTSRTEIFYARGGVAYVYQIYGIHQLFNVVTNKEEWADAVLIRAIEPIDGIDHMLSRRNLTSPSPKLTAGPGSLSKALGITKEQHYGCSLNGPEIWISPSEQPLFSSKIIASPRVGVGYAEEDAFRPWRFRIADNKWTSPAQ